MIFAKNHLFLNQNFNTQEDFFIFLDTLAHQKGIIQKKGLVYEGLKNREKEGTTGFENGFAIPHARISGITKPKVFFVQNSKKIKNWKSLDNKGVQIAIVLLIPKEANSLHMDILSKVAAKLMDKDFQNLAFKQDENSIFTELNKFLQQPQKSPSSNGQNTKENNKNSKFIIGISACPAGIAHTFMVKQKMENIAQKNSMNIKWETQGANGQKNKLTNEDIEKADYIIIASDIEVDLSRFLNKKILLTSTNHAIKQDSKILEEYESKGEIYEKKSSEKVAHWFDFVRLMKKGFQSSFGKPWIYLSITATLLAIIALLGYAFYGQEWTANGHNLNKNLFKLQIIAQTALYFAMPFMAGHIAKKVTGKLEAFGIVFISCFLLNMPSFTYGWNAITGYSQKTLNIFFDWNNTFEEKTLNHGSNILGAVTLTSVGVIVFYFIKCFKNLLNRNKNTKVAKFLNWGVSPWVTVLFPAIVLLGIVFFLGAPLSYASSYLTYGIIEYSYNYWWLRFIIGGIFGVLIASDLGGLLNKLSLISLIGLAQHDLRFASIIAVGIPLASLGYGTTYFFFKKKFKNEDAQDAAKSFRKGLNGMTEGPLFPLYKYGLRIFIPNAVATFVATGLSLVLGLYIFKGGHIGVLFGGAQANLSHPNDIEFLNSLLPRGKGFLTIISSIAYGIISYYLVMCIGSLTYASLAYISFSWPGKKRVFK